MEYPTMNASDAIELATKLAKRLATEIEDVNRKYPYTILDQEFFSSRGQSPMSFWSSEPTPFDAIPIFRWLFLSHIAKRYIIVPDVPLMAPVQ